MRGDGRMSLVDALRVLRSARRVDDVVVAAMGAAREWMALGTLPLDWVFVPSSMGQATSLGLGLALARPDRRIVVLAGDGGLLMNLGSLVTITACAPANLVILLFDNGVYEVTGAQPTPAAAAGRTAADRVDFATLAVASGFRAAHRFQTIEEWTGGVAAVLAAEGPTFAVLEVAPVPDARGPRSPGPAPERARAFMAALSGDPPNFGP
ncbi:MAG TPA: thiamine pyrophosphate-dependent enzyme [Gemmatimonadales bacterium]|nr:thiamine pyrophosphate-dependent enzyme [Gemmatimonadales bacterium]